MTITTPAEDTAAEIAAPVPGSVRALISELAQLEDAVREVRSHTTMANGNGPVLDPHVLRLLQREAEIVGALRNRRHSTR